MVTMMTNEERQPFRVAEWLEMLGIDTDTIRQAEEALAQVDAARARDVKAERAAELVAGLDAGAEVDALLASPAAQVSASDFRTLEDAAIEVAGRALDRVRGETVAKMARVIDEVNDGLHDPSELVATVELRRALHHRWWPGCVLGMQTPAHYLVEPVYRGFTNLVMDWTATGVPGLVAAGHRVKLNSVAEANRIHDAAYPHKAWQRTARTSA